MILIVISPEDHLDKEHELLKGLFENGLEYFHLRKPLFNQTQLEEYINQIPTKYHQHLILHSHHHLDGVYHTKGIHFPERLRPMDIQFDKKTHYSTSFHNLNDLKNNNLLFDYVFLSPIYKSISKKDYNAAFDTDELSSALKASQQKMIALGGIDIQHLEEIKELGFEGVALLGAIWSDSDPIQKFIEIKRRISDPE